MRETTQVQFPRFQYENHAEKRPSERDLMHRATARPWIKEDEVERLVKPVTIVESFRQNEKRKNNWWGVRHNATHDLVLGDVFKPVYGKDLGKNRLFRMWHITHNYEWDQQAIPGTSHELVLEKLDFERKKQPFEEVAALLINNWKKSEQQMLVLDGEEWVEPAGPGKIDIRRDFCLQVMGELAARRLVDLVQPLPQAFCSQR